MRKGTEDSLADIVMSSSASAAEHRSSRPEQTHISGIFGSTSQPPPTSDARRNSLPFSLGRPSQSNISSTTLVSSTAEGKPIPVDGSTAENRTCALRELNKSNPSRHHYARSTGAANSTYSEPVIVRTYYPPAPSRQSSTTRRGVIVHHSPATSSVSRTGSSLAAVKRALPFSTTISSTRNASMNNMAHIGVKKGLGRGVSDGAQLPPIEAFTFRSFMANMDSEGSDADINSDLDRIAEICARSRYSLSNQYEVHYAPHGSGTSFLATARDQENQGPTLQVVSSEDERNMRRNRRRHGPPRTRRNSRAMGTLETIMSSSRSSDEDRHKKKKSAAEIAEEVRGRAARKGSANTSPTMSTRSTLASHDTGDESSHSNAPPERNSAASLALIDGPKQRPTSHEAQSPRSSAGALVGQPALPQASTSQLEIRTVPESQSATQASSSAASGGNLADILGLTRALNSTPGADEHNVSQGSLLSALSGWMSWSSASETQPTNHKAEGSLRELLKTSEGKGKSVEREE